MARMIREEKVETSIIKPIKEFLAEEGIDYIEEKDTIKIGKDQEEIFIKEGFCTTEIRSSNVDTKINIGDISTKCERSSLNYPNFSMISFTRYKNNRDLHISTFLPTQKSDRIPIEPMEKMAFVEIPAIPITSAIPLIPVIPITPISELRPKKLTKKEREEFAKPKARLDIIAKNVSKKDSDYTNGITINCKCDIAHGTRCLVSKLESIK